MRSRGGSLYSNALFDRERLAFLEYREKSRIAGVVPDAFERHL